MSKTLKRLVVAAFLSGCGFLSTVTWYKMTSDDPRDASGAKRIARLEYKLNNVQRKQVKKLIWQPALESEDLYVGEAIRTASNAEARIVFLNSNTAIDLEPDSAIVLEESDGQMALNFLKGNILVQSDAAQGGAGLTLRSGDKNIALGKSQVSFGKAEGEELNLQVLTGSVSQDGKVLDLSKLEGTQIRVLSPLPSAPVYLNTRENESALFKWTPLKDGYSVYLEAGDSRDQLRTVAGATAQGDKGELRSAMKIGRPYFRLVARSKDANLPEITSPVMRAHFIAKIPPQPLAPEKDSQVAANKSDTHVQFLWSNPAGFTQFIIEIASSPDLKNKVSTEYLKNITQFNYKFEKSGAYYWRVSGVLEGQKEVVSSNINKFELKIQEELSPPEMERPLLSERISEDLANQKGVNFSWKAVTGAVKYKIYVTSLSEKSERTPTSQNRVYEEEGTFLQTNVKDLKVGQYQWSVASVDSKGNASKFTEARAFSIQSLPLIRWADNKLKDDYYYITLKPSAVLEWKKDEHKASRWRLTVEAEDASVETLRSTFQETATEIKLPKDGIYRANVEGLDERGQVVARSEDRRFRVGPAPLLPPPAYAQNIPDELEANRSGNARINWQSVSGAAEYILTIKTPDGNVAREVSSVSEETALRGLMPGKYVMTLKSVDKNGRSGPEGEEKTLLVPDTSNVKAPKLKGLKVK